MHSSLFDTFKHLDQSEVYKIIKSQDIKIKISSMHKYLTKSLNNYLTQNYDEVKQRGREYSATQDLPGRDKMKQLAYLWEKNQDAFYYGIKNEKTGELEGKFVDEVGKYTPFENRPYSCGYS